MHTSFIHRLRRFLSDENGPTSVEYAAMLALIVAVILVAVSLVGFNTSSTFNSVSTSLESAASGSLGKTDGNANGNGLN